MDCHDGMRILKEEMENLDEKIVSYQMDLIKLGLRHNALKFQEEWIEERSQELQNLNLNRFVKCAPRSALLRDKLNH